MKPIRVHYTIFIKPHFCKPFKNDPFALYDTKGDFTLGGIFALRQTISKRYRSDLA